MAADKQDKVLNVPTLRFPEFRDEWVECELQDIADISKGTGISKEQLSETGESCILYGELYTKYKSEVISNVVSKTDIESTNLVRSKANDVIIPSSGETAIDISTARCVPFDNILLGGDLNIIRLKEQDGRFFSYQLNGVRKLDIAQIAQGVSVVHLYGDSLKRLKVHYPSISEQKKISSLLSVIDERIETQNRIIEKTKSLIKGLANLIMDNPSDCIKYLLGDLCEIKSGYSGNQLIGNNGLRVSRIETISNHHINLDRVGFVAPFEKSEEYKLNIGDILFSNINSVEYIGNTAYIDKDYSLYHGMNLLRLIPQKPIVSPFFLYCLLNTDRLKNHFKTICNKAVSQASINQTELSKIPLLLPDMSKQIQIANLFKLLLGKKEIELSYYTLLIKQKKYLLSKLFI